VLQPHELRGSHVHLQARPGQLGEQVVTERPEGLRRSCRESARRQVAGLQVLAERLLARLGQRASGPPGTSVERAERPRVKAGGQPAITRIPKSSLLANRSLLATKGTRPYVCSMDD
jgi:hypothetical protein